MLTLRSERQLNFSGKDDEKYPIPIQVVREIMKEGEKEEEDEKREEETSRTRNRKDGG